MFYEHDDAIRNMLRRVTLVEVDDSGPQQKMVVRGLAGEELRGVVRVQPYGFTSNPPAGAEGLLVALGGRSDRAMLLGVEHPDFRQKSLGEKSTALYDAAGNIVSIVQGNIRIKHASSISIEAGPTTITIDGSGMTVTGPVQFNGPSVRHNSKNIGDTHTHSGIQPGGANTAVPNA